jgi:small nuclear ribonucleoprotein (snRNP)-like protein
MAAVASRKYFDELGLLVDKAVSVESSDGNTYDGTLLGYDGGSLSVVLGDVAGDQGTKIHRIFIYGSNITKISASERPFNLQGLADRLERVFPNMTRIFYDAGVIVVMDKIRVNEAGLIEGSGPAADRVRDIYQRFISEAS